MSDAVREVIWAPVRGIGFEHCRLTEGSEGPQADGLVIGVSDDVPFRARYGVACDAQWRVRAVRVDVEGRGSLELEVEDGHWETRGKHVPALDGCVDVDLSVTPFTNTLPIRRLELSAHESRELQVAYVDVPSLRLGVATQRYTCLLRREDGTMHRYESGRFAADLTCDVAGLVIEYPHAFTRLWPR